MDAKIKDLLRQLQPLPKYQFERRIDIFILNEIEEVFSKILKKKVRFLYPEFPLRNLAGIDNLSVNNLTVDEIVNLTHTETNRNTNVDYLLASEDCYYFVELKTDLKSVRKDSQLIYYAYYSKKEFTELYNFFKNNLANGINQDNKWKKGLEYLQQRFHDCFGKNIEDELDKKVKIIYLGPEGIDKELNTINSVLVEKPIKTVSFKEFNKYVNDKDLAEILSKI